VSVSGAIDVYRIPLSHVSNRTRNISRENLKEERKKKKRKKLISFLLRHRRTKARGTGSYQRGWKGWSQQSSREIQQQRSKQTEMAQTDLVHQYQEISIL